MPTSTLTKKGQTTLPKAVIEALKLKPAQRIVYLIKGDCVTMEAAEESLNRLCGSFSRPDKAPLTPRAQRDGFGRHLGQRAQRGVKPTP